MTKRKSGREETPSVARRNFLKGATLAGAGALAAPLVASGPAAAQPAARRRPPRPAFPPRPTARPSAARPPDMSADDAIQQRRDFMVDVMRGLGIEHAAAFVGSSFRGLHESIINVRHADRAAARFPLLHA